MGTAFSSSSSTPESRAMARIACPALTGAPDLSPQSLAKAKEIVASAPVVVFSKSYCPFCVQVKKLLTQLGASFKAIEMDTESDGPELQSALAEWTGQRTVPNVFINGKHIGGCDDTVALNKGGKLVALLTEAGAISGSSSKATITA